MGGKVFNSTSGTSPPLWSMALDLRTRPPGVEAAAIIAAVAFPSNPSVETGREPRRRLSCGGTDSRLARGDVVGDMPMRPSWDEDADWCKGRGCCGLKPKERDVQTHAVKRKSEQNG